MKFERILCPVDFSELSAKAYDYAYSLAKHYRAKLFVEHVIKLFDAPYAYWMYPEPVDEIRRNLRACADRQLQEFLKVRTHNGTLTERIVQEGVVTDSILSFAVQRTVDLIVMGTHGRQGFDHMTMGSVTEKVLRKARCPVLAVRRPAHDFVNPAGAGDPIQLRKILFCTDFSENSDRASFHAFSLAQEYHAELTLLYVLEEIPEETDIESATAGVISRLKALVPQGASRWCGAKTVVCVGKPYEQITQFALDAGIDLVIMGVRGRNALDLALFGSTTHRVIQLGPCPVLAVHI